MYIEPCCCDKQLPKLLREGKIFFQTNGDVTVEKMMRAIGYMPGDFYMDMWLVMPTIDDKLLRVIKHWFLKGWIGRLYLITTSPQEGLVYPELAVIPDEQIIYAYDNLITEGLLAFVGKEETVAIQGTMLTTPAFSLRMYAGVYGKNDDKKIKSMLEAISAKMNVKTKNKQT